MSTEHVVTDGVTGKRYLMRRKESGGVNFYSFDSGETWHPSRGLAFVHAQRAGKLFEWTEREEVDGRERASGG